MGLISYTNLVDGNPAGANDINQRFGDILAQVNGNIDASNIRKGTLTRELFAQDAISAAWPIGAVFISVEDVNPGSQLGGSWVKFGEGKTLIGVDTADTDFDESEKTGGSKAHNHGLASGSALIGSPSGNANALGYKVSQIGSLAGSIYSVGNSPSSAANGHPNRSHNTALGGSTDSGTTLQPYITVYFWKRVS